MPHPTSTDWWRTLYDDIVADLLLVRKDQDELRATIRFLLGAAALSPGDRVLDQGCGIGSLSLPLARAGLRVLGVDQSAAYVARATAEAAREGLACTFYEADAFSFHPPHPVDAVVNWYTTFGNADDARNREMIARALESLRPGGTFLLDYQHIARVFRHFREAAVTRGPTAAGEAVLLRESEADLAAGVLRQRWTVVAGGRTTERHSAVRLYLPRELETMLTGAGFVEVRFFGGVAGEPLTLDSPRCILTARRPTP